MRCTIILFLIVFLNINSSVFSQQDTVRVNARNGLSPSYRFFLKGETHEYKAENANSLLTLVKYLTAHHNLRYLVMEFGPDHAFLANAYLKSGDDTLLLRSGLYLGDKFWQQLRLFNESLEPATKIEVLGFDFNRYGYSVKVLQQLLKDKQPGNAALSNAINTAINSSQQSFDRDMKELKQQVSLNEPDVKKMLGKEYDILSAILNNITPSTPHVKRDKEVVKQFLVALPQLPAGSFLFNFGIAHIFLNGVGFAKIISEEPSINHQVCSIYPFYLKKDGVKSKFLKKIEEDIPGHFRQALSGMPPNTLVNLEEKDIYPGNFKKSQWMMVIKDMD
jgi:hypothetical protein